jgi:alpha-tubulin suppressor-like RCC1 family protein
MPEVVVVCFFIVGFLSRAAVVGVLSVLSCKPEEQTFGNPPPRETGGRSSDTDASTSGGSGGREATGGTAGSGGTSGSTGGSIASGGAATGPEGGLDIPDRCVDNGCGACSLTGEHTDDPCGDCGHYVCSGPSLVCESPRFAGVQMVRAGGLFSCALLSGGKVRCWGNNELGELGDGTFSSSNTATTVDAVAGATWLSAGYDHACALIEGGAVKCWGNNASGGLGDGTTTNRSTAVTVVGLAGRPTTVEAGAGTTCVILDGTGVVQCWGDNRSGQIGDGTMNPAPAPAPSTVRNLTGALAITAGRSNTCVLLPGGVVKCWGSNALGQLGTGTTSSDFLPTVVPLTAPAKAVSAGSEHACAVLTTGGVQCWGRNNYGQLGDDSTIERHSPVDVSGLSSGVAQITVGGYHSCAIMEDGSARCWGFNLYGGVGDTSTTNRLTPAVVNETGVKFNQLSAGSGRAHTCAVLSSTAKCFGPNNYGQLGDGSFLDRSSPVRIQGLDGICP